MVSIGVLIQLIHFCTYEFSLKCNHHLFIILVHKCRSVHLHLFILCINFIGYFLDITHDVLIFSVFIILFFTESADLLHEVFFGLRH